MVVIVCVVIVLVQSWTFIQLSADQSKATFETIYNTVIGVQDEMHHVQWNAHERSCATCSGWIKNAAAPRSVGGARTQLRQVQWTELERSCAVIYVLCNKGDCLTLWCCLSRTFFLLNITSDCAHINIDKTFKVQNQKVFLLRRIFLNNVFF